MEFWKNSAKINHWFSRNSWSVSRNFRYLSRNFRKNYETFSHIRKNLPHKGKLTFFVENAISCINLHIYSNWHKKQRKDLLEYKKKNNHPCQNSNTAYKIINYNWASRLERGGNDEGNDECDDEGDDKFDDRSSNKGKEKSDEKGGDKCDDDGDDECDDEDINKSEDEDD